MIDATYVLPVRRTRTTQEDELASYLRWLARFMQVVVVDGSPDAVFKSHATDWRDPIEHIPPDDDLRTSNGKVGGVLTGVRRARHERIVIADDDVRYDSASLMRLLTLLELFDVVRPQNYFVPAPWHARWDMARSLLNRVSGGDWPGTLGIRRSLLAESGGYNGDVLFENLELVRTMRAAGAHELVASNLYVRRLPPGTAGFWSQRVRQAYDEFARPWRMILWLLLLPFTTLLLKKGMGVLVIPCVIAVVVMAETGRRRDGGAEVFPPSTSLIAPLWLVERAICAWLALGSYLAFGGAVYHGRVLRRAASSQDALNRRVSMRVSGERPS